MGKEMGWAHLGPPRISQLTPLPSTQIVTEVGLPGSHQALPQLTADPYLLLGGSHWPPLCAERKTRRRADDQPDGFLWMLSDGQSVSGHGEDNA